MGKILITGASGVIGQALCQRLNRMNKNNEYNTLTTNIGYAKANQNAFLWNISNNYIHQKALEDVDTIIHLAGANIGNHRWTRGYKKEILDSRVESTKLLFQEVQKTKTTIKKFIGMSGIGFYPDPSNQLATETSKPGDGFVSKICIAWENEYLLFSQHGSKITVARTAPVLQANSGLLAAYLLTSKLGIIPTTGDSKNMVNWIHIDDVVDFILDACLDSEISGIYNLCSPNTVTQNQFVKAISHVLGRKKWHPNIPSLFLKMVLGDRAVLPLTNHIIIPQRLIKSGRKLNFPDIEDALKNLLSSAI